MSSILNLIDALKTEVESNPTDVLCWSRLLTGLIRTAQYRAATQAHNDALARFKDLSNVEVRHHLYGNVAFEWLMMGEVKRATKVLQLLPKDQIWDDPYLSNIQELVCRDLDEMLVGVTVRPLGMGLKRFQTSLPVQVDGKSLVSWYAYRLLRSPTDNDVTFAFAEIMPVEGPRKGFVKTIPLDVWANWNSLPGSDMSALYGEIGEYGPDSLTRAIKILNTTGTHISSWFLHQRVFR